MCTLNKTKLRFSLMRGFWEDLSRNSVKLELFPRIYIFLWFLAILDVFWYVCYLWLKTWVKNLVWCILIKYSKIIYPVKGIRWVLTIQKNFDFHPIIPIKPRYLSTDQGYRLELYSMPFHVRLLGHSFPKSAHITRFG